MKDRFDVFLCHNSEDKSKVKEIGSQLIQKGLRPWLDEWELRPGTSWQSQLEKCIDKIDAAAVFLGPSGIGPWQKMELDAYLREFVKRRCPVIPVILPRVFKQPALPIFLSGMTWVDFRQNEPDPLARLMWGIKGEKRGSCVTPDEKKDKLLIYLSVGGTCRDPIAKVITLKLLKEKAPQINLRVEGMALGQPTKKVVSYAARNAINEMYGEDLLADYAPNQVTTELLEKADLVLVMETSLKLNKILPKTKTYVFKEFFGLEGDIDDPYPDGKDKKTLSRYKERTEEIKTILENNFDRLLEAIRF